MGVGRNSDHCQTEKGCVLEYTHTAPAPAPRLVLSHTLNWRRRLAISYSRCSSMPRRRHHLREFLLRSDFTWVEVQIPGCQGLQLGEGAGGPATRQPTPAWTQTPAMGRTWVRREACSPPRSQPSCPLLQEAVPDHTGSDIPSGLSQHPGLPTTARSGWSLSRTGLSPCTGLCAPGGQVQVVLATTVSPVQPSTGPGPEEGLGEHGLDIQAPPCMCWSHACGNGRWRQAPLG